ncbi:MAG: rhomboid family intramembrane serine protease [Prevotellaceae bacterium]|jgi:membrane associated rhomboid family serine protease|nr:rhomboid family intramembrane serine protease [Prevotellaceae bacterium]
MYFGSIFGNIMRNTPPIVKNLIIINALMLLATFAFKHIMVSNFALFYPESPLFRPYQLFTYMFMHGGFTHFFFNMYALWMFGQVIENAWGGRRFLFYYLVTGLGAMLLHLVVLWIQMSSIERAMDPTLLEQLRLELTRGQALEMLNDGTIYSIAPEWSKMMLIPTLGASGAVFGVLLAFGMMFPETRLMLIFPPIPLKAKWLVIAYGVLELCLAFAQPGSSVAHFAHLGGMLFGLVIIKYWQSKRTLY